MVKYTILIALLFSMTTVSMAGTKEQVLLPGNLAMLAPPYANKDYFAFEFGFVTEKKIKSWDYDYNAYVTASLFQDWKDKSDKLRAGALGFKGGVILPTQPWIPLLFTMTLGYAKTALHKSPFFGKDDASVARKDMILIEAGLLYHYNKYFLRFSYQQTNVKYFSRHTVLALGVVY